MTQKTIILEVTPQELLAIRLLANSPLINNVPVVKPERLYTLAEVLNRNGWPTSKVLKLERSMTQCK
jgi:hypothetical protein